MSFSNIFIAYCLLLSFFNSDKNTFPYEPCPINLNILKLFNVIEFFLSFFSDIIISLLLISFNSINFCLGFLFEFSFLFLSNNDSVNDKDLVLKYIELSFFSNTMFCEGDVK